MTAPQTLPAGLTALDLGGRPVELASLAAERPSLHLFSHNTSHLARPSWAEAPARSTKALGPRHQPIDRGLPGGQALFFCFI